MSANFREPKFINQDRTLKVNESAFELYYNAWFLTENKSSNAAIRGWFSNAMDLVKLKVGKLKKNYFIMWTSKMHKKPPSQRVIAIPTRCTTKPLTMLITLGLKCV